MIDDDEEVDARVAQVIGAAFQDPALDFIGGPYLPLSAAPPPDWLPDDYLAVLGRRGQRRGRRGPTAAISPGFSKAATR